MYGADTLTGTFVGNGTVIYDGTMPASPADKFTSTSWRGTLWLERITNIAGWEPTDYGNHSSTIRMSGVQLSMHTDAHQAETISYGGTLDIVDSYSDGFTADYGLEINNGWADATTRFAKLTGTGTIKDTSNAATHTFAFTDASGFTGSFNIVGKKRIKIGTGSKAVGNGQIVVQPGTVATVADSSTWSAAGGIQVYGTLNVEGKISGSVQRQEGGKFVVTSGSAVLGDLRDFTCVTLSAEQGVDTVGVE